MPGAATRSIVGATVVFGTTSYSQQITSVGISGAGRTAIPTSHLGTTLASAGKFGSMTFRASDLVNPGTVDLGIHYDPDDVPIIDTTAETCTITWAALSGDSTGSILAASYIGTDFSFSGSVDSELCEGSITGQLSGNVTRTAAT